MNLLPHSHLEVLKRRDFFVLILTVLLGQVASAFLLLSLITSVYSKTGSNFSVSGIILSVSVPALFLMAFAGLISDVFDRKKIIVVTNFLISLVVGFVILAINNVYLSIFLSFLYFAINSFFFPAVSAATTQLVKKRQLLAANGIFFLTLAGGQIAGFFIGAVLQFFFGELFLLLACEALLVAAFLVPIFLPNLFPRKTSRATFLVISRDIWNFFTYIFRAKTIWFFFLILASTQGIIAFGGTLAPGYFDAVAGLPITKSPLFIFPPVALGNLLGALFRPKFREGFSVALGFGIIGIATAILGIIIALDLPKSFFLLVSSIYLVFGGFGLMILMISSRTVLQRRIAHSFQGSVFGANFVASSLFASIGSPLSATMVAVLGYPNVLASAGLGFLTIAFVISLMRKKWNF